MPPLEIPLDALLEDLDEDDDDMDDGQRASWWEQMASLPMSSPQTQAFATIARERASAQA